jgi:hypothetical protein
MVVGRSCQFRKRHLNFDEFNTYSKEKKLKKLDEVAETVRREKCLLARIQLSIMMQNYLLQINRK